MDDRAADAPATPPAGEGLIYTLTEPERGETAVLVEVPHAGLAVPEPVRGAVTVSREVRVRDSDTYVDKLYEGAPSVGASLLAAHVSRYVVDLNRAPDDVDPETVPDHPDPRGVQPRGVVWRVTADGKGTLSEPLTYAKLQRRIALYHEPYHAALRDRIGAKRARFGHAIVLAAHSMPSASRAGRSSFQRADVVPGSRGRTSADARVIECVGEHFLEAGLSVKHDDPYRGGWTTAKYGKPQEGSHVIQVELNRGLYLDEASCRPKDGDFEALQALVVALVAKLGELKL